MRKLLIVFIVLILIVLFITGLVYWIYFRPITPEVLNANEQNKLDQKIEYFQARTDQENLKKYENSATSLDQERTYLPGKKVINLSEREVNALLHKNTSMGNKVRIELENNAVHARISTDLDPDLPIVGGRKLIGRARFLITSFQNNPSIIIDDVTVWGISLPNAWLANLKGKNLLTLIGVENSRGIKSSGIKDIEVRRGHITIRLDD